MRDLCEAWKNTGRVDKLATQAMSFCRGEAVAGRGGVPKAPGMALRASYREERFRQSEGAWDAESTGMAIGL